METSGSTSFVLATVRAARGIHTCGIANNPEEPYSPRSIFLCFWTPVPSCRPAQGGHRPEARLNRITTAAPRPAQHGS
jgi:hypothetical protein